MFVLATDFGLSGPYVGQVHAVLASQAPTVPVVNLFADLPAFNPRASAYLLSACSAGFRQGSIFLCVVDPGVGTERDILLLHTPTGWFIGPDNGLLAVVAKRSPGDCAVWRLRWRPEHSSATFHGRDVIAPVAVTLANGQFPLAEAIPLADMVGSDWPDDLAEVVYFDHYGNALTGLRADRIGTEARVHIGDRVLERARTFSDRAPGAPFWYANSNGLVEFAVNQGRAERDLALSIGTTFSVA
ncbi:MAG: SAM-dependent chlorinase/fluorinase [Chromatiales bacterium]|nr:SAM-dependent chlorinase/fluorinase [Gammaproteobacteria bacterium]MCP5351989.1 SAM-dependent chlorinase/fluorinase [Chromatiales bacterium]